MGEKLRVGSDFSGIGAFLIDGYDNYFICPDGSVYNAIRKLKPQERSGYLKVSLSKNGVCKQLYVHRLVARHFIPNPENKKEVNHINGNKKDNRVENLEWVSRKENAIHSYQKKLQISQKGSAHGQAKLTEKDVVKIRKKYNNGLSLTELSKIYEVSIPTLSQIVNRKRWKHVK